MNKHFTTSGHERIPSLKIKKKGDEKIQGLVCRFSGFQRGFAIVNVTALKMVYYVIPEGTSNENQVM